MYARGPDRMGKCSGFAESMRLMIEIQAELTNLSTLLNLPSFLPN